MKLLDYYEEEDFGYTFFVNALQYKKFAILESEAAWDDFPSWTPAFSLYVLGSSQALISIAFSFGRFRARVRFCSYAAKNLTQLRNSSPYWPHG